MIRVQEIEVSLAYGSAEPEIRKKFNFSTYCITDFVLRLVEGLVIGKIKKIVIECTEGEITKKSNPEDDSMNLVVLRRTVDIKEYLQLPDVDKKKWTLGMVLDGFKELHAHYDFPMKDLQAAAETIREMNFINHYYYGKSVPSPDKKMSAQLWAEHEMDKFDLSLDIFDAGKEKIQRIFVTSTVPNWVGYDPVLGSIKWDSNKSVSVLNKKKKPVKKIALKI